MTTSRPVTALHLDRLKEAARRHELREEWRPAIEIYLGVLDTLAAQGEPADPALHNRIGDLELRAGDAVAAIASYELAVEAYADQGYFNNAIALCGKILRVDPSRAQVFLRLADLQARKNVIGEVRRNLASFLTVLEGSPADDAMLARLSAFAEAHEGSPEIRAALREALREVPNGESLETLLGRLAEPDLSPAMADPLPSERPAWNGVVFLDAEADVVVAPSPEPAPEALIEMVEGFEPTSRAPDATEDAGDEEGPLVRYLDPGASALSAEPARAEPPFEGLDLGQEPEPLDPVPASLAACHAAVEAAFRAGDQQQLVTAYLALAAVLQSSGAPDRASLVYQRVLDHEPDNAEARAALAPPPAPEPPPSPGALPAPAALPGPEYVDLGALILDPAPAPNPRMRVDQPEPNPEEDVDFREALEQFKQGLAIHVDATDFQSHYDLGVAFKEMGLLDEAIAQFQKALRAPGGRLRGAEALGIAFFEQGRLAVAESVLSRAVDAAPGGDDEKIGLIYWLGRAYEAQGKTLQAIRSYERALAEDITFLDLRDRLARLSSEHLS